MRREQEVADVLARWQPVLLEKDNVVAVGAGYKTRGGRPTPIPAIVVYVTRKVPLRHLAPHQRIPPRLEGIPTDVVEAGEVRALEAGASGPGGEKVDPS
ncbi:MAG: hypothetical protein IMW96_04510 [Thermoanaerobacteraceae bacterium]|nr:hypothetical protein [Thermoanaerobacteraceae bacterium]